MYPIFVSVDLLLERDKKSCFPSNLYTGTNGGLQMGHITVLSLFARGPLDRDEGGAPG